MSRSRPLPGELYPPVRWVRSDARGRAPGNREQWVALTQEDLHRRWLEDIRIFQEQYRARLDPWRLPGDRD